MVYEGFRLRSTEVDRGRPKSPKYLEHFLVVLMDWEAQTLPKLNMFNPHHREKIVQRLAQPRFQLIWGSKWV